MRNGWRGGATVEENAAERLPAMAAEYFAAGRAIVGRAVETEELHRFRLQTKHFRYTLELFGELYGPEFAGLLKKMKPVQDALGEINDAATALGWLRPGESAVAEQFLRARIAKKSAAFERYWTAKFDTPGELDEWTRVLAAPGNGTTER